MPISTKSVAYRAAAKKMDYYAVCLVGWDRPRPSDWGDNQGVWPVKIVIRKKESDAAKEMDSETPHAHAVVLEHVLVETWAHATRLKGALNEVLLGYQEEKENRPLKSAFRNVVGCWEPSDEIGRQLFWAALLQDALRILSKTSTSFDVFDDDEAYRRISTKAMKGR